MVVVVVVVVVVVCGDIFEIALCLNVTMLIICM
jgi:hypothetical protein